MCRVQKVSAALRSFFNPPYCEWFNAETDASSGEVSYTRWAATLAYVARIWREEGPFDGYLGFSQGATVCHALAALHARGACPELAEFPAPRFALCFSGRRCRDSALAPTLYDEAALAELRATELEYFHAWNEGDTVVKAEESASMADTLGGGRHTTPSSSHAVARLDRAQLTALEAFLDSQRARAKYNNATAATWWDFMASYCSVS